MADSIVRLRVESQEYDAKLKRATEGLTRYADECRKVGGTLEVVEQETLEYVRSLGQMDTASRTATGKLNEMKKTFVELKTQYNQLTEAEKASPFGQALGQSLEQLKGRIKEGESALKDVQGEVNGTGGVLDQLASKFTLNVDAIKLFEMGMKAVGVVADVAKDAFFKNEEQLDEWGRVVEGAHSVYEGFLSALNTGDIGGYLSNINNIIQAARDAYDALDSLGTYNAFNQVNVERTRTNMTQAIADYRTGEGTREQAKAAGNAYKKELADRRKLEQDAYLDAIKKTASERGINAADLLKALSGNYGQYQALKDTPLTGTRTEYRPGLMPGQAGSYTQVKVAANEQERLGEALRQLNDTELQALQALGAQAQRTGNEIAQVDRTMARMLGKSGGASSGGTIGGKEYRAERVSSKHLQGIGINQTENMASLRQQLSAAQQGYAGATNMIDAGAYQQQIQSLQERIKVQPLALSLGISTEAAAKLSEQINTLTEGIGVEPIEVNFKVGGAKELQRLGAETGGTWKDAASAVTQLGGALQSLEDPGAKVAGIVASAIANIALTFASSLKGTVTPWDWIAASIAGTATMISTIAAIHSATGYAEGGVIPGNSFSGDNQLARVNAGELILSKSAQANIANQLDNASLPGDGASRLSYVRGQDIFLGVNNYLRSSGRGQLVTSR